MEQEILIQEIEKLKQFLSNEITPNGILSNHLNLLIAKLTHEYYVWKTSSSNGGNKRQDDSLITLQCGINATNNVVLSGISIHITTKDLLARIHEVLGERMSSSQQQYFKILRNNTIVEINDVVTLQMCGICDRDVITFDFQFNNDDKKISNVSSEVQEQPAHPFILSIQRSNILPLLPLEAIALAAHAILLQSGFICIYERDSGKKQVAGFAQPLSGCLFLSYYLSHDFPLILIIYNRVTKR